MGLISVVVPFFNYKNAERLTLWRYVKAQKSKNFEVIVVNNGSDAEHATRLRQETAGISNLRIVNLPEHVEFSAALNEGIRQARGEFITFWKPSDMFEEDALQELEEAAKGFDLAVCSVAFLNTNVKVPEEQKPGHYLGQQGRDDVIFSLLSSNTFVPLGNKLYRTELIKKHNLWFDELASEWNADELFNISYLLCAESVNVIDKPLYVIATTPIEAFTCFDDKRLLEEYKAWFGYLELICKLKLSARTQNLVQTLFLNKIYLAIGNLQRGNYPVEDKLQFLQTILNDELINKLLMEREEQYSFCYFFVEYLILAVLDAGYGAGYVENFQKIMEGLLANTHADILDKDNLLAVLHKTRKMDEKNNFLLPMLQADIYLSLFFASAAKHEFRQDYFESCRKKCRAAMQHKDNKYGYGQHIYDAVRLDLVQ